MITHLNKVELIGRISTKTKLNISNNKTIVRFALATNYCYRDKDGYAVIETTWHNCVVCENSNNPDINKIKTGADIHLFGRIRTKSYTDESGEPKYHFEIVVKNFEILDETVQSPETDNN